MSLPIKNYHSYEHIVEDLNRAERFYVEVLGFKRIGKSSAAARETEGMQRLALTAGPNINLILSQPIADFSVAANYLKSHPEGIGFLNFRVSDIAKTYSYLNERGAAFLYPTQTFKSDKGSISQFAIATALDDVTFRFIDDSAFEGFGSAFEMDEMPGKYRSPHRFECIDHFTSNVRTLQPLVAFFRDVMGFEEFWRIDFHTNDVNPNLPVGSGLKSIVMWHPDSGIKFANNEPAPPYFRNSQIDIYLRDNRGSGVQHMALRVPNIIDTMTTIEAKHGKGKFLAAPDAYYERVPARLQKAGFTDKIREPMAELAKRNILIDGSSKGYLLQIFSHEVGRQFDDPRAGALFVEIIQREGDDGFGGGNFRALFESIEIDQIAMAKTAKQLPLELI